MRACKTAMLQFEGLCPMFAYTAAALAVAGRMMQHEHLLAYCTYHSSLRLSVLCRNNVWKYACIQDKFARNYPI